MNEWMAKILEDIRKGSAIQFVVTIFLIVSFTGYEVTRGLSPIATTAILYWDGGFTQEELERSKLHGLCDNLEEWPMSTFIDQDPLLKDKCRVLKRRHMLRTSEDWLLYQRRARELQLGTSTKPVEDKPKLPVAPLKTAQDSAAKETPKEMGLMEEQPP